MASSEGRPAAAAAPAAITPPETSRRNDRRDNTATLHLVHEDREGVGPDFVFFVHQKSNSLVYLTTNERPSVSMDV
jgi:hypothetical protein